jgi:hypothetical protein
VEVSSWRRFISELVPVAVAAAAARSVCSFCARWEIVAARYCVVYLRAAIPISRGSRVAGWKTAITVAVAAAALELLCSGF